jgi:hypothetical protein
VKLDNNRWQGFDVFSGFECCAASMVASGIPKKRKNERLQQKLRESP